MFVSFGIQSFFDLESKNPLEYTMMVLIRGENLRKILARA